MPVALDPRFSEADGDYRVKIFKATARSARDEVEHADAAVAERWAEEWRRSLARREAEVRTRDGRRDRP